MAEEPIVKIEKANETVKVCIRCRPLSSKEVTNQNYQIVQCNARGEVHVANPSQKSEKPKMFTFDLSYGDNAEQKNIYEQTASPIVSNVLEGYNGTIFAYGQTGTGKTHTMSGADDASIVEERGIMPRSFNDVFDKISNDSDQTQFLVRVSYLEIYNENVRDLLSKNPKNTLDLHEDPDRGVYVKDLSYFAVKKPSEVFDVMKIGQKNRSVGETNMNARSSRSHSLFCITVERSDIGADGKQHIRVGKLNMVDLAGSERIAKTGATGDRLKEATKINLSLSTLCHVISTLTDPKATYIPYRDSRLTRLLQDSLGGNTKTVMIANIGPADYNYDETLNTLRYASRAKNIKNKPRINEDPKDALLREYQDEITKLRQQLEQLHQGMDPSEVMAKMGDLGMVTGDREEVVVEEREDTEKMKQYQEKLEAEKLEIKEQAKKERDAINNQKNMAKEEKERIVEEIRKKEEDAQKAKTKHQKMLKKLQKMKEKLVVGDQAIEMTKQQKKQIRTVQKDLNKEIKQEAELKMKLEEEEEDLNAIRDQFTSLDDEYQYKVEKLEELWGRFQLAAGEMQQMSDDFDRERNDMYDTIYELTNQLKLKNMIIDNFIAPEEYRKYEKIAEWNEDLNDWTIRNPTTFKEIKSGSKRPQSAVGMKRPTSEYSRIAKGLGDLNPRYKFENILQLDLDMPERTTEEYEGMPSPKVQQAIQAILNDQDIKNENIPITTLINFGDACLEDGMPVTEKVPSNRPKSGKRPKSVKKRAAAAQQEVI